MAPSLTFLYLHGGPGLNSFAEQAILGPLFAAAAADVHFWNEPSCLRPHGDPFSTVDAFASWLSSAERALVSCRMADPVHLIAHSFAALPAIELARRQPDRVRSLVIIAPATHPMASFTNVLRIAQRDLMDDAPDIAARLGDCIASTCTLMDEAMREGFPLVVRDSKLFTHYYARAESLRESLQAQSAPEAQLDLDSFFAVLGDFSSRWLSTRSGEECRTRALVLFGACDPITPHVEQIHALHAELPHATVETFEACSHFVHLDAPGRFVERTMAWAKHLGAVTRSSSRGAN